MANALVKKKKPGPAPKITAAEARAKLAKLENDYDKLKNGAYCYMCDSFKSKTQFHSSTNPRIRSGITPICKRCAYLLAVPNPDKPMTNEEAEENAKIALRYLDKPFIRSLWNASIREGENLASGKVRGTVFAYYIKNISMNQYSGLTWDDSDMFKQPSEIKTFESKTEDDLIDEHAGQDTFESFKKNKFDVIRLLDYDPFEKEAVEDQPFLYSQLLGMLDASEDANEDMMRVSSAIQIVRAFLQSAKIDDTIAKLMGDVQMITQNSATIKSLQDSKQKLTSMITNLAAENCLSLKNSKSKTKGEDTFVGRLRKIRELNLRDSDLNGYDIETCKGMQQVANASMEAIIRGLHFTEDEMSDIVAVQRRKIGEMDLKTKSYREAVRILLKENLDLRDTLDDNNINKGNLINLDDFVGTYMTEKVEEVPQDE